MKLPLKLRAVQFLLAAAVFYFVFRPAIEKAPEWIQGVVNTAILLLIVYSLIPSIYLGWLMGGAIMQTKKKKGELLKWSGEKDAGRRENPSEHAESPEAPTETEATGTD